MKKSRNRPRFTKQQPHVAPPAVFQVANVARPVDRGLMTNSHTFGPTQNEEFTIKIGEEGIHVWQLAEKRRKSDWIYYRSI